LGKAGPKYFPIVKSFLNSNARKDRDYGLRSGAEEDFDPTPMQYHNIPRSIRSNSNLAQISIQKNPENTWIVQR
jgi:hypothetical protein